MIARDKEDFGEIITPALIILETVFDESLVLLISHPGPKKQIDEIGSIARRVFDEWLKGSSPKEIAEKTNVNIQAVYGILRATQRTALKKKRKLK